MKLKKARLINKKRLTYNIIELEFETLDDFKYEAGQYITIKIDDNDAFPCFRAYSFTSAPQNGKFLLCIKVEEMGRGSQWLNKIRKGKIIEFIGPIGKLSLQKGTGKKHLFIATGVGVAPFKSIIEDALKKGNKSDIELIFGLRYKKDIFYKELFEKLAKKYKNFTFSLTLTRPDDNWKGNIGRVTSLLENIKIDRKKTETYICGSKAVIKDVLNMTAKKKLPKKSVHMEDFG